MIPVDIVVLAGAMGSSTALTLDIIGLANNLCLGQGRPAPFDVRLRGSGAFVFEPLVLHPVIEPTAPPRLVIVPAQGLSKSESIPARLQAEDAVWCRDWIRAASEIYGADVASSCTGTLLVANAGLLNGRRATTAWWLAPVFQEMFPAVRLDVGQLVVNDGNVTTAGAAMAQMDLMVGLVARYVGAEIADRCARTMVLDARRSQTPYMAMSLMAARDERISRVETWARDHLERGVDVTTLASVAGMSPRTFARRVRRVTGMSPIRFLQRLRAERAIEMVEGTTLPFEEIARRVGYAEPSTLRQLIQRERGMGPRELRAEREQLRSLRLQGDKRAAPAENLVDAFA